MTTDSTSRLRTIRFGHSPDADEAAALRADHDGCLVLSARTGDGLRPLRAELFRRSGERREVRAG